MTILYLDVDDVVRVDLTTDGREERRAEGKRCSEGTVIADAAGCRI